MPALSILNNDHAMTCLAHFAFLVNSGRLCTKPLSEYQLNIWIKCKSKALNWTFCRGYFILPRDWSLSVQPISIQKAQSREKPTYLCAPREFLKMCPPCLIIIQSLLFDYRIARFLLCSLYLDILRKSTVEAVSLYDLLYIHYSFLSCSPLCANM